MLRPLVLVLLSVHINVVQGLTLLVAPIGRVFVFSNWATARLFVAALVFANWNPLHPLELVVKTSKANWNLDRALIVANHQTLLDWMFLWLLARHKNRHGAFRITLKDSLRWIPVFGWGMNFFSFVFLSRDWSKDEATLLRRVAAIRDSSLGYFWFLLFPEGTIISPDTLEKARKFAVASESAKKRVRKSSRNVPPTIQQTYTPTRVLVPRYKGLWTCLRILGTEGKPSHRIQALLDITMAYEPCQDVTKGVFPEKVFSPRNVFLPNKAKGFSPPTRVHMQIEEVDTKEWIRFVESGDEIGFDEWLRKRWIQKESILERFHQTLELQDSDAISRTIVVQVIPSVEDIVCLASVIAVVWIVLPHLFITFKTFVMTKVF